MPLRDGNMLQLSIWILILTPESLQYLKPLEFMSLKRLNLLTTLMWTPPFVIRVILMLVIRQIVLSLHALTNAEDRALTEIGSSAQAITSDVINQHGKKLIPPFRCQ